MLIADLVHSCSNDKVAQAALHCIGGSFAERVRVAATENGISEGRFVAVVVRDFALRADEETRGELARRIAGADQPILMGLRHLVEKALEDGALFFDDSVGGFGPQLVWRSGFSIDGMERLHRARLQAT
jgi:hypothetical protein